MDRNEYTCKAPMFDGTNYAFWSKRMETYLSSLGFDVWMSVKNGYTVPQVPPTNLDVKREHENNAKAKNTILSDMSDTEFVKVMQYTSIKETWDKLQSIYEGDAKVKEAKLQNFRAQFENMKMKDEEKIANYPQRVDDIVSAIIGLEEVFKDEVTIKKVLRSLTTRYDTKVSAIEEDKELKTLSLDELFGSLSTYEMRTISGESSKREVAFNITKKGKEEDAHEEEDNFDVAVEIFVRKLKKGSGKYKEEEVEAEVDFEGELVSALEELWKVRKEYKMVKYAVAKEQDILNKCLEEFEKKILDLRT
ncbi:uncharacterized protein LOC131875319 [Cryptomeria japonica]|uniref:uncharacterized protein LOC131875319 n=1 Tax=Cryptomeria japonica TaxID=3369 RepID=UPI0027DA00B2|nr:uncharacterized protein LOC131875319 [Cryptomeria japonica]